MFEKLETVELRFIEVEATLAREGLTGKQLTALSKERGHLLDVVEAYRRYKQLLKQRESARSILANDSDADMRAMAKEELLQLEREIQAQESELQVLTLPKDPNDDRNIIVEIRAGTGGDEAAIFAGDLFRMYQRFVDKVGWRIEILQAAPSERGGFKEIIGLVSGEKVYSRLKFESGVHRVQRVPETEAQGRVHTSACTVAILPEADDIEEVAINPVDLEITVCRSSGAGGQHVNTTDSAVRILHKPSGIVVECQEERSQHKNKDKALKVLRAKLFENAQREQQESISADRKSQVGSGDRSERIRTYNFPQGRMTDHRINLTLYKLSDIMDGDIMEILDSLAKYHQAELLKQQSEAV